MPVSSKLLCRFPFFAHVPDDAMKRVSAHAVRLELEPNTYIFRQGDVGDAFYMIVSGAVEILNDADGTPLNLLRAGEWFGDFALLDDAPRSASVRTQTRTTLIALPKQEFLWVVTSYPVVLHVLATSSQQQLRERDRVYIAEVETRARQLDKLYRTARDITRHLDRDRALEDIRDRAIELLESAGGDIFLYDQATKQLLPRASSLPDTPECRVSGECVSAAFTTGQVQAQKPTRRAAHHELAAPILLSDANGKERSLGVLRVYRAGDGMPYSHADSTLLELFASQAAIVIENADLIQMRVLQGQLDKELQNARRVQQQLIPAAPPHLPGYQIATLWHPARQVSGDYFDFIPLEDGHFGFVIADVSGKGLDAALFMANARATLRASARVGDEVAAIMARANDILAKDSMGGMFVTAFMGLLDPVSGFFSYCNAGHNPPLLWRARRQALELLATGNRALAILPNFVYQTHTLVLERGDLVVLYTDGVTEASDARDDLFGMERLAEAIQTAARGTAQQVIRQIDTRVRAFTGAYPQSDDITVVALRRT